MSVYCTPADAAVSLLESLPPNEFLPDHIARIRAVLARVSGGGNINSKGVLSVPMPLQKNVSCKSKMEPLDENSRGAVFANDNLLANILRFEGSLALLERNYYCLVGYTSPKPSFSKDLFRSRRGVGSFNNALVCKKWHSMVVGSLGRNAWKVVVEESNKKNIDLAKKVATDESMSWSARICAMAISNDAKALKKAFAKSTDDSQGVGAAFTEQEFERNQDHEIYSDDEDDDDNLKDIWWLTVEIPCPKNHPFYYSSLSALCFDSDITECYDRTKADWIKLFAISLAFAAAEVGSVDSLKFLQTVSGTDLWSVNFDHKGSHFLGKLVECSCISPLLDGPVSSIRYLLSGNKSRSQWDEECLHQRHRGGNGNNLHLAAARGHKSLVEALLEGGMDPNIPCEKISSYRGRSHDPRDRGVKELPLPADWAEVRGHSEIVKLLQSYRNRDRPDLRCLSLYGSSRYQTGMLFKFFPSPSRQYGFIKPGGIFVHLNQMRKYAQGKQATYGYPTPGQKLCFTVTTDRHGRKRAEEILDGSDFSHLRLPLDKWGAEQAWERHKYGYEESDDSEDDDFDDVGCYGGGYDGGGYDDGDCDDDDDYDSDGYGGLYY